MSRKKTNFLSIFKELNEGKKINLIIDGMNLFIISMAKNYDTLTNDKGEDTAGLYGAIRKFISIIREIKPDKITVVFDNKGSLKHKYMFKDYKAQRKVQWKKKFDTDEQYEGWKNSFGRELHLFKEFLRNFGCNLYEMEFVEGDFIISLYLKFMFENTEDAFVLTSTDKDFTQLLGFYPRFIIFNPITKKIINPINYKEYIKLDIPIELILLAKMFLGDKSDNIPRLEGFGEKTVEKLLTKLYEEEGVELIEKNNEDIINKILELQLLKGKKYNLLLEDETLKLLNINRKLMDLLNPDKMIETDKILKLYDKFNKELNNKNKKEYNISINNIRNLFQTENFYTLLDNKNWAEIRELINFYINSNIKNEDVFEKVKEIKKQKDTIKKNKIVEKDFDLDF